jgi:nucleolar protein 56
MPNLHPGRRRCATSGVLNPHLASLLELNLSKSSSKAASSSAATNVLLGVEEKNLGGSIKAELGIDCDAGVSALELIRGVRLHAEKMLKGMEAGDVMKSQLGLGHSYSRAKVKVSRPWSPSGSRQGRLRMRAQSRSP